MSKWDESQIWIKLLKIDSEEAKKVRAFLSAENCLSKIQTILSKSGTASKDFTLHDEDHSFRVAERMRSLIPDNTKEILSEYKLALLLLSAYLHDIGMNPEYNKVQIHYDSLKTDNKLLPVSEKIEFQKWLDDEGWLIDLDNDKIETESEIQEILTAYCRHKHNDWSEEWIRGNFSPNQILGTYTNWMNDLINICRSHHYGLEELKEEKFNPLRINSKVIHIRYIAMCLRLADVIEIDPERAPEVLLKHRNVIEGSISHWLKEKFTSVDVINDSITITANPTKAFIHKAILDVADQIENETILCNTLIKERPLNNIYPTHDLIHS